MISGNGRETGSYSLLQGGTGTSGKSLAQGWTGLRFSFVRVLQLTKNEHPVACAKAWRSNIIGAKAQFKRDILHVEAPWR